MEDNRNNGHRDYGDFFESNHSNTEESRKETAGINDEKQDANHEEEEAVSERPFYYAYSASHTPSRQTAQGANEEMEEAAVSVQQANRTYPIVTQSAAAQSGQWNYGKQAKRSGVKSMLAAFLAGALVVSTLMFAADKYNLFTGASSAAAGTTVAGVRTAGFGGNSAGGNSEVVRPNNIAQIASTTSPAIVKVETLATPKKRGAGSMSADPFFRQFFGDFFGDGSGGPSNSAPQENSSPDGGKVPTGLGTGFVFDKTGYIITNEHVVDGAEEIQVTIQGFKEPLKAKLLGSSYDLDLAVLKVDAGKDLTALSFGSTDAINVGDWVVAIGNPYGFDHTVTVGVLSAKERPIDIPDNSGTRHYKHLLQTDASINPGNSGGPLLNLNGEVVGINTAVNAQAQGIGFAIPSSTVLEVIDTLKAGKEIPKQPDPYIGVSLQDIDKSWLKELNISSTDGSLVAQVVKGSPAAKAGIQPYDVITEFNGKKIKNTAELTDAVKAAKVGDKATVTITRDGQAIQAGVIIGDRNAK